MRRTIFDLFYLHDTNKDGLLEKAEIVAMIKALESKYASKDKFIEESHCVKISLKKLISTKTAKSPKKSFINSIESRHSSFINNQHLCNQRIRNF